MKPPSVSQGNGQLNGQPDSPNLIGYPNGNGFQNPVKKVGDEQERLDLLPDVDEERSLKSVTHLHSLSLGPNGSEPGLIHVSQQPPIPNIQAVDVDTPGSATAPRAATTSILAALSPPLFTALSSPTTPTPFSMSFASHQRRHPAQLDLTSDRASLEPPSSMQSSGHAEATPRISTSIKPPSSGGSKADESIDGGQGKKGDEGSLRGTTIIIPDSSATLSTIDPSLPLSSISTNPNPSSTPTTSRPTSVSIDTALFSNRPAPPSPALSRRVSGAASLGSTSVTHSRSRSRSSLTMSCVNSMRMSGVGSDARRQSLGTQLSQFMAAGAGTTGTGTEDRNGGSVTPTTKPMASSSPLGSPHKLTFTSTSLAQQASASTSSINPPSALISVTSPSIVPTPSDPTISVPVPASTTASPPSSIPPLAPAPVPATPTVYIRIRDFGFASTDERHLGLGTDVPKANRVHRLNRKLGGPDRARARAAAIAVLDPSSGATRPELGSRRTDSIGSMTSVDSSDADVEEEEEEEDENGGWGMSGWGKGGGKGWDKFKLGMGRFSWTTGSSNSNIGGASDNDNHSKETSSIGTFPSRKDLDMNFMDSSSSSSSDDEQRARGHAKQVFTTEEFPTDDDDGDYDETTGLQNRQQLGGGGDDEDDEDEYADAEEEQEILYPGLYRALYAFEPEGTAEMKLDEDQIVRVVGRGGGVGWAVVIDDSGSSSGIGDGAPLLKHALVPEGYLEVVRLDWEDEEEALASAGDGDAAQAGDN
ncbi:hypothetical protein BYT27DRAFT_7251653 [Phlegmacium glaucopus]|nr:hypothetical protein BYT27DRAFT_7251653 [Phlegmacium glaucopus]